MEKQSGQVAVDLDHMSMEIDDDHELEKQPELAVDLDHMDMEIDDDQVLEKQPELAVDPLGNKLMESTKVYTYNNQLFISHLFLIWL